MTAAVEHVLLHECEGVTESPIFFFRGDNSAPRGFVHLSPSSRGQPRHPSEGRPIRPYDSTVPSHEPNVRIAEEMSRR